MLVEFVIVVVFGVDSFFWDHDAEEDAFVLFEELSFLHVFEGEVGDDVELHGDVGSFENFEDRTWIVGGLRVIYGPMPIPGMRVTVCV